MRNDRRMGVDGTEKRQALTDDENLTKERKRERIQLESGCKSQDAAEGNRTRHSPHPPYVLFVLSRDPPASHFPLFHVNPTWYHVSFPDDGNFLPAARLTYFLPDNGLKFHAVVVTIHSKKLIEPGATRRSCRVIPRGSRRRERGFFTGCQRNVPVFPSCSCAGEKHAVPVRFLRNLMKQKKDRLLH